MKIKGYLDEENLVINSEATEIGNITPALEEEITIEEMELE